MKAPQLFSVLSACLAGIQAAAPSNPCHAAPFKVMHRFAQCSTASDFCSSYLEGSATFTKTVHTTTITSVPGTTLTSVSTSTTSTSYITSVITAETVSITSSTGSAVTESITQYVCPVQKKVRDVQLQTDSCNLARNASPTHISAACECILASTTTTTKTISVNGPTSTVLSLVGDVETTLISSTYTPSTTIVVPSTTVTVCSTPPSCTGQASLDSGGFFGGTFSQYYSGSQQSLSGGIDFPQFTENYQIPADRPCDAIQNCANSCGEQATCRGFAVLYFGSTSQWTCYGYYGNRELGSAPSFDVQNSDVQQGYGYEEPE